MVQLPLPKNINARKVIDSIDSFRDIDCLTSTNLGKLTAGNYKIVPPTAKAVLEILASQKIKLAGKNIVIVGRGDLVGKPLAILLTQEKNTVISCNKYTKNLSFFTKTADILISAAGKRLLIKESMVKKGVIAIDAGTSFYNGKICGDLDFLEIKNKAKIITPTPGGVGPMTVACLLDNLVFLTKHKDILS